MAVGYVTDGLDAVMVMDREVALALKPTAMGPKDALSVLLFVPIVVPNVHVGEVANPDALVTPVPGLAIEPPPAVTAKAIVAPGTGLPY